MASTYLSLHYHVIFSTFERQPVIDKSWRSDLHEYLGGTINGLRGIPEINGGTNDHVHLLMGLKSTHCLADVVREIKKASSKWAEVKCDGFAWQEGYAAFTVSASLLDTVREYIANQEEHHRKVSFRDELKLFLEKSGIDYDPRYLD